MGKSQNKLLINPNVDRSPTPHERGTACKPTGELRKLCALSGVQLRLCQSYHCLLGFTFFLLQDADIVTCFMDTQLSPRCFHPILAVSICSNVPLPHPVNMSISCIMFNMIFHYVNLHLNLRADVYASNIYGEYA